MPPHREIGHDVPLAVVIPTYQERANVLRLLPAIRALVPEARLYVVDDDSPDGTGSTVEALATELGGITAIHRKGERGLAGAYMAGFAAALRDGAQRVVQMDADFSHDPADVPRLLAPDADLVLGSRYVPGGGTRRWPLSRRLLSRFGSLYARAWTGLPVRDLTGGFKAWRRPTLDKVLATPLEGRGYVFQVELTRRAWLAGARIVEVPIVFTERADGSSKMSLEIGLEAARTVPRLGRVPPRPR